MGQGVGQRKAETHQTHYRCSAQMVRYVKTMAVTSVRIPVVGTTWFASTDQTNNQGQSSVYS